MRLITLKTNKEFNHLLKRAKKCNGKYLILLFVPNFEGLTKVGIIISKKIDKRAVRRNRLRRQLKEIMRLNYQNLIPGFNILLNAKAKIKEADFHEIKNDVLILLDKASVLKK